MKKFHIWLILTVSIGLLTTNLIAQESDSNKVREIYLNGNLLTFNNFGLQYKSSLKENTFLRIGLTNISIDLENKKFGLLLPYGTTWTNLASRFEIGLEKRKPLSEKLSFFYGINLTTSISFQRVKTDNPSLSKDLRTLDDLGINPGLAFNTGFILNVADNFSISAEIIPQFILKYSSSERISGLEKIKDTTTGGSFVCNNESARISFIYRWNKN